MTEKLITVMVPGDRVYAAMQWLYDRDYFFGHTKEEARNIMAIWASNAITLREANFQFTEDQRAMAMMLKLTFGGQ